MAKSRRVTQDRLAEPRRRQRNAPVGQDLFAGLVALMLIAMMTTGFIWIVMRSFGGGAWVQKATSPSPKAGTSKAPSVSNTVKPGGSGTINGQVMSAATGSSPAALVCAMPVDEAAAEAGAVEACINLDSGVGTFKLPVSAGTYYVLAKLMEPAGVLPAGVTEYFSEYVTCKRDPAVTCSQNLHQRKLPIPVANGAVLSDIDVIFN